MEKESNNQNNNNSREKNKYIQIKKQYLDDSETYDSSTKYRTDISEKNNSLIEDLNRGFQKSIGFFPKKIYLEEPEIEDNIANKRKYSMEEHLIIKDFVPHLKPIEMHLVPSKLNLNGFRNLKYNKDNILLNNKYISCPDSEEESDDYLSQSKTSDEIYNIKKVRKNLKKLKNYNIPKVMTKNIIESNCKLFKDDYEYDSEKESLDLDDNFLLYNDDDYININNNFTSLDIDNENKKVNKEENEDKKNRINSCSILDALKNRLSLEGTI